MPLLHKLVNKFWLEHPHIIKFVDSAVGISNLDGPGTPITATKWVCILCGKEIIEINDIAIDQLHELYNKDEVFNWMARNVL